MWRLVLIAIASSILIAVAIAVPAPAQSAPCTKVLEPGGDLSTFVGSLRDGDVGCIRQGAYRDGCVLDWTLDAGLSRAVLRSYPGEMATLNTSLRLMGDNLDAQYLNVEDIASSCGGDMSGFEVRGANPRVLYNRVYGVSRHGVLTGSDSSNVTIHGNRILTTGSECNLDHGIYFQTSGRITRNVISDPRCGYGIHLYSGPSNAVVAYNTIVGSRVRGGIVIDTSRGNIQVYENVLTDHAWHGVTFKRCATGGCIVDRNITWNNAQGPIGGALAAQATNTRNVDPRYADLDYRPSALSPMVDTAVRDAIHWPDRDSTPAPDGPPDVGAYEYKRPAPEPTPTPTAEPTVEPTPEPTVEPTPTPTETPSC
jgi:hypothetical protein